MKKACAVEDGFRNVKNKADGGMKNIKGHPMEYELRFIVWCGIHDALKKAIERKDVEAVETLKEAVEFYNRKFIICGKELEELLRVLESIGRE
ncbi:hypothetical protein [Thermoanaerobacterium sp. DL9XJH110]|uniref:hypothetical protein n=1 Tax=Thermoanaerobacterium sp. DL9XJH110 TaxID=3386643 RepID=UPI003BB64ECA